MVPQSVADEAVRSQRESGIRERAVMSSPIDDRPLTELQGGVATKLGQDCVRGVGSKVNLKDGDSDWSRCLYNLQIPRV